MTDKQRTLIDMMKLDELKLRISSTDKKHTEIIAYYNTRIEFLSKRDVKITMVEGTGLSDFGS